MAGPYNCHNPTLVADDKLVGSVSTKGSNTCISSPAMFQAQIPTLAQALAPTPGLQDMYTNIDLQRASKLALTFFVKGQNNGKAKLAFLHKGRMSQNANIYYRSCYMKCYYFC